MTKSSFGTIQYLDTDRYRIFWSEGRNVSGKRIRRSKIVRGSRDDAELELARVRLGISGIANDTTWSQYWDLAVRPTFVELEKKTISGYERVWNTELLHRIGNKRVSDLSWRVANETIRSIQAPSVQRAAHRLLRKISNMAVNDGIIERCPVDRSIKMRPENKRKKHVITPEEVINLLRATIGTRYHVLILLEIGCGLRHEEACAIIPSDISMIGDGMVSIDVSRALVTVDGKKVLKGLKTECSRREVVAAEPFSSMIIEASKQSNLALIEGKNPSGGELNETWFANPMHISRNWKKWCDRNGVEYVRFSDMRTIYSVIHGEAGSIDSLVSLSMGHSDGTTRGRNYQKTTRRGMIMIAETLMEYYSEFLA